MVRQLFSLIFFCLMSLSVAFAAHGVGNGIGHGGLNHGFVSTGGEPPGLVRSGHYPHGLAKKNKIPHGWYHGKKTGWDRGNTNKLTPARVPVNTLFSP